MLCAATVSKDPRAEVIISLLFSGAMCALAKVVCREGVVRDDYII